MKIFVIGFNKTGSTTIHEYFKQQGFKSFHGSPFDLDKYDVFSDGNISQISKFKYFDQKFKDSKFILNVRDFRSWCISRFCHGFYNAARSKNFLFNYFLKKLNFSNPILNSAPNWAFPARPEMVVAWAFIRSSHHKSVIDYFLSDPNLSENFICVDINKTGWLEFTSERLKLPLLDDKIYTNVTRKSRAIKKYKLLVEEILEKGLNQLSHADPEMHTNLLSNSIGLKNKRFNDLKKNSNFYI